MSIQSTFINLSFYIVLLGIAIDFIVTGIFFQRQPKTFGMLIIRLNQPFFETMRKQHRIYQSIYSLKGIRFLIVLAGILLALGSVIQIVSL